MLIAERFGKWPEECETREADRAIFYNQILWIEGSEQRSLRGLGPGDEMIS